MSTTRYLAAGFTLALLLPGIAECAVPKDVGSNPTMIREAFDDSAEAIKERSGPGDALAGARKSFLCQGCHGTEGMSSEPMIPNLAGQYARYIAKQVKDFQAGLHRSHQIMNAMAGTVNSETDLNDIAAYFASQQKMESDSVSPGNPMGEDIFLHGDPNKYRPACVSCHGVKGKGVGPTASMYPVLGGQKKEYIREQLIEWRERERTNSPGDIMNTIAKSLTDEQIEALADYVSSQ